MTKHPEEQCMVDIPTPINLFTVIIPCILMHDIIS